MKSKTKIQKTKGVLTNNHKEITKLSKSYSTYNY